MPYTMPHHAPRKPHASRVVLIGLLMASLVGVIASASAAPIVSVTRHKDLGFRINTTFPPQHKGDSFDGCPFVPPGLPAGVSYGIDVTGSVHANVDFGADIMFSYDKANVSAGANLPVNITYTPTAGSMHVTIPVNVHVEGCVVECFLPDICGSIDLPCLFEVGPSNFVAPLTGDAPVVIPITSCVISLSIAGVIDVGSAHVEGSITLSPVPAGGLALGGAVAAYSVQGPGSGSLIPVLEWDTSGQTVAANVALNNPLPGCQDVNVRMSPVVHWVATSANLRLVINLGSVFHDLGIGDPSPISLFSDDLGSIFTAVGLDTQVHDAIVAEVGFDPGFGAAIAAGKIPVPLLDPELAVLNIGDTPSLGHVDFTFSTDVTPGVANATQLPVAQPCGWNNTSVQVQLNASDNFGGCGIDHLTYSAAGAQPIGSTNVAGSVAFINITTPGITTIDFYSTDNQGNIESVKHHTVRIDEIKPDIAILAPLATQYSHSATLILNYLLSDLGGSGVAGHTAFMDGSTTLAGHGLESGQSIDLLTELALGFHTFRVDANDCATNTNTSSVTFEIIVTPQSIIDDVNHFAADGSINKVGIVKSLLAKLNAAAKAFLRGDCETAANIYQAFILELEAQRDKGVDGTAVDIMIADAQYLQTHCGGPVASGGIGIGGPGGPPSPGNGFAGSGLDGALSQRPVLAAWPMPYRNGQLNITFAVSPDAAGRGDMNVRIYDLAGRLVRLLPSAPYTTGSRMAMWDGSNERGERASNGIYFVRANGGGADQVLKVIVSQ